MLKNDHIVSIRTPAGHWGYDRPEEGEPEGHYQPISLQWSPYTATDAREVSLAGGDPTESSTNRSYKGYTELRGLHLQGTMTEQNLLRERERQAFRRQGSGDLQPRHRR